MVDGLESETPQPANAPGATTTHADDVSRLVEHWKAVDAAFAGALKIGISLPLALDRLGVQLFLRGSNADARDVLATAQQLLPNEPSIANNLAVVLERLDQTDEAIRCSQRSLAIDPSQEDSWIFLGNLKRKRGDLRGAAAAYESAVALNASASLAWQGLGFVRKEQAQARRGDRLFHH